MGKWWLSIDFVEGNESIESINEQIWAPTFFLAFLQYTYFLNSDPRHKEVQKVEMGLFVFSSLGHFDYSFSHNHGSIGGTHFWLPWLWGGSVWFFPKVHWFGLKTWHTVPRCRWAKKGIEPLRAVQVAEDLGREEMASLENFMWDGGRSSWTILLTSHHGSLWNFSYKEVPTDLVTTEIFLVTNKEVPTDHPTRRNRREMIRMIYLNIFS